MNSSGEQFTVNEEKRKWKLQFRDIVNASLSQPICMQFLETLYTHITRGHQIGFVPRYGLGPLGRPNAKNVALDTTRFRETDVNHSRLPDLRSFLFPACDDDKLWELSEDDNGKKVKQPRPYNQKLYNLILHHSKGVVHLDYNDEEACDQCAGAGERNVMNHCSFAMNEEGDVMFNGWCLPCHMVANKKCSTIEKGKKKRLRLPAVPKGSRRGDGNRGQLGESKSWIESIEDQEDNQIFLESAKKRHRFHALPHASCHLAANESELEKTKSRTANSDDQEKNYVVLQSHESPEYMVGTLSFPAQSATICGSPSPGTVFTTPQKARISYCLSPGSIDSRSPTIPPNTPMTQARLEALFAAREALAG